MPGTPMSEALQWLHRSIQVSEQQLLARVKQVRRTLLQALVMGTEAGRQAGLNPADPEPEWEGCGHRLSCSPAGLTQRKGKLPSSFVTGGSFATGSKVASDGEMGAAFLEGDISELAPRSLRKTFPGLCDWQDAFKKIHVSQGQRKNVLRCLFSGKCSKQREVRAWPQEDACDPRR